MYRTFVGVTWAPVKMMIKERERKRGEREREREREKERRERERDIKERKKISLYGRQKKRQ